MGVARTSYIDFKYLGGELRKIAIANRKGGVGKTTIQNTMVESVVVSERAKKKILKALKDLE